MLSMNALRKKLSKVSPAPGRELWWLLEAVTGRDKYSILHQLGTSSGSGAKPQMLCQAAKHPAEDLTWLSVEQRRTLDEYVHQRVEGIVPCGLPFSFLS